MRTVELRSWAAIPCLFIVPGFLGGVPAVSAQQVADKDFHFPDPHPAFAAGQGPRVCIDAGHNNYPVERYEPLANLLSGDGYRTRKISRRLTAEALADCDLLVTVGPLADSNRGDWAFPHPPALTRTELEALFAWIRAGGGLLFIGDHSPFPAAASDLGTMLGVVMVDGTARLGPGPQPDVFTRSGGNLSDHPILRGRTDKDPGEGPRGVARRVHHLHRTAGRGGAGPIGNEPSCRHPECPVLPELGAVAFRHPGGLKARSPRAAVPPGERRSPQHLSASARR